MAGILDFVSQAAGRFGIGEDTANSATCSVLSALKGGADPSDFSKLLLALPGAEALMGGSSKSEAPAFGGGLGGMFSSLPGGAQSGVGDRMGMAGSALGGETGGALGLLGTLQSTGLSASQAGDFMKMFLNFVQERAGADLLRKLTSEMPELEKFLR